MNATNKGNEEFYMHHNVSLSSPYHTTLDRTFQNRRNITVTECPAWSSSALCLPSAYPQPCAMPLSAVYAAYDHSQAEGVEKLAKSPGLIRVGEEGQVARMTSRELIPWSLPEVHMFVGRSTLAWLNIIY